MWLGLIPMLRLFICESCSKADSNGPSVQITKRRNRYGTDSRRREPFVTADQDAEGED